MSFQEQLAQAGRSTLATSDVPLLIIEPSRGWISLKLGELWEYRELLFYLTWRDVKVRYKQTVLSNPPSPW